MTVTLTLFAWPVQAAENYSDCDIDIVCMAGAGSRELQSTLHKCHLAKELGHTRGREAESGVPAAAEGKRSGNGADSVFFSSSKENCLMLTKRWCCWVKLKEKTQKKT